MISRTEMRTLIRAARGGWGTPEAEQQRAVEAVQETLDNPETSNAKRQTALQTMAAFRAAGWAALEPQAS